MNKQQDWKIEFNDKWGKMCVVDDMGGHYVGSYVIEFIENLLTLSESRVRGEERERIFGNIRLWFDSYQDRQLEFTTDKFIEYLQEGK